MSFPNDSPFYSEFEYEASEIKVVEKSKLESKTTSVHTSDLEDIEHELRQLEFDAGSPGEAGIYSDLANRVAALYKG